ncbi:SGNH/GDSL hydrolase family protein [Paracraurococcus lichenis]|uniref:SGNH/GDSL hydrolase family protein n=1 Tax=Paracraurococcus lichenis TaxID=3064888 RepID=A0ABT9DXJ5_9PROT|nr:SGNH/GDSL hydrolase family protein [Paracraurococcus sp. LOR1-02]MDO9708622.1 SGNH/GDSL hydrolase family protein [Paracraurococcus sp. LOR1-02]
MSNEILPRVCLIGTSNGVMRNGYAAELAKQPYFSYFENRSIGFSSSHLFFYALNQKKLLNFDYVILDFACNDGSLLYSDALSEQEIQSTVSDAIRQVIMAGSTPIVLILPIDAGSLTTSWIRRVYRDICERSGVLFFDAYHFAEEILSFDSRITQNDLFQDYMHVNIAVAQGIAQALGERIKAVWDQKISSRRHLLAGREYRFFSCSELGKELPHPVMRATSLVSASVHDFGPAMGYDVYLSDQWELAAVVMDFAHSEGVLSISGETNFRLGISSEHFRGDSDSLVFGIWPLRHHVKPHRNFLRINVLPKTNADAVVAVYDSLKRFPPSAALVGFVACRELNSEPSSSASHDAIELSEKLATAPVRSASASILSANSIK